MPPATAAPEDTEEDIKPTADAATATDTPPDAPETEPKAEEAKAPEEKPAASAAAADQFQPEPDRRRAEPVMPYSLPEDNPDARHLDVYAQVDKQAGEAFNREHPFAPSTWQPGTAPEVYERAARQSDIEAQRQAHADRLARNADLEAQMRGSSQRFYTDPYGNVQPVMEEGTGKPLYNPTTKRERGTNPQTGEPAWMTMDKYGQTQYQRPNLVANPQNPHDGQLYYDFGNGQQEPAGKVEDLLKSSDFKVQRAALKAVHASRAAKWKESLAPMQELASGTASAFNAAKVQHDQIGAQIEQLQSQADSLSQDARFNETTGGVMGFGAKPSDAALQLQAQHDALQNQIESLGKQRDEVGEQIKPTGSLAVQKRDAQMHLAMFKAKASYDNYADLAQERRAILKAQGKPETDDPTLQSILQAQTAYQGAIGKFGSKINEPKPAGANATPPADDASQSHAGFQGEPYQLAAKGVKGIGDVPVQNLARLYGSGQGEPKPAALLAMKQRIGEIADTLGDKNTTLAPKVRDGMQQESDYLNSLFTQRFAKLGPGDQRKINAVLNRQNIGAVSDTARRFAKGVVEAPGQIAAGTGRLAEGAQKGIVSTLLKAYEAQHGKIPESHREALVETVNQLVDQAESRGGASPGSLIKGGEAIKGIAGKIPVNPNRDDTATGTLARTAGNIVGALPAAAAGLPGAVLAGSGMMREQTRDQALASGDSKELADAKGNMAALAGGALGLVPGGKGFAGKTLTAAAGRVALKGLEGAGVNAAADIALQKASTGKIDWQQAAQQAEFGGIFGALFSLPDAYRGRAQARIEEAGKAGKIDPDQAQKIVEEERAKAKAAGLDLAPPPSEESPASTGKEKPSRDILSEPTTAAQKSALAFHEELPKQESAEQALRQSPLGYDELKKQLQDEQKQAEEQSRKLSTPELEARRDAIEKHLNDLEALRQSPRGGELLRQDLANRQEEPARLPVEEVSKLSADDFAGYAKNLKGGFTGEAYRVGAESKGDAKAMANLSTARESALAETKQALNEGRMDDALALASKAQFFREAIESATGTGSAAHEAAAQKTSSLSASTGDKTQTQSPKPDESGPTAKPLHEQQAEAIKTLADAGYTVQDDGKFSVLSDASGKQVREGEVPEKVKQAFATYREARLSETKKSQEGQKSPIQETSPAGAEKDIPAPAKEEATKPNVATMKRPELLDELEKGGLTEINGKPVDQANPAQLMNAVFKLRKAQESGQTPTTLRTSDKLISALEGLKLHREGQLSAATPFSLAWDAAIDTAILSIKAGRTIADAVKFGIGRLKERFPQATDDHIQKFESAIRKAYGNEAKPVEASKAETLVKDQTKTTSKLADMWKNLRAASDIKQVLAATRDAADTRAGNYSREVRNEVNDALGRSVPKTELPLAQDALSFYRENGGGINGLKADRAKIAASSKASPKIKARALAAIDYALAHPDALKTASEQYKSFTDAQVEREQGAGLPTLKTDNYVPRYQDVSDGSWLEGGKSASTGASNRKVRTFEKLADSISAGIDPKSLNAIDTLELRIRNGEAAVQARAWQKSLKDIKDPSTGEAIAITPPKTERADGSTYFDPPKGHDIENVGNEPLAIKKEYSGTVGALTDPSWFSKNKARLAVQKANAIGKSVALAVDTFHLGRLAFRSAMVNAASLTGPKKLGSSFKEGLTLLEHSPAEIMRMGKTGEIPAKDVTGFLAKKLTLNKLIDAGLNTGRVADMLHQELVQKVPIAGPINKFIFQKFQRGAMADAALLEYDRQRASYPEMPEDKLAAKVAREVNVRFGNLGRQGFFKSKTAQDIMRLLVLAPQWNEGLIRSEVGGIGQIAKSAFDAATGKRFAMGLLGREMLTTGVSLFVASQIINQITRGKFTWENPEEGFGAKISAWIPDKLGGGAGFFLNPMGLTAETAHLLLNSYERAGNTYEPIINYLRSRASVVTRPLWTFATGKNQLGQNIKPEDRWAETGKAAIPAPISGGAAWRVAKGLATGGKTEKFPGEFEKQAMQSFGLKTDNAPSPEQRIVKLAHQFNQSKGIPAGPNDISDYQGLNDALRRNNPDDIEREINALLEKKSAAEIEKRYKGLPARSFTGKHDREAEFIRSLNPEQRAAYGKARQYRQMIATRAEEALRQISQHKSMAEAQ